MQFALAVHEEAGKFGVTVPDLPGCFAAGESLEDAIEDALGAIDAHVEVLIEDGAGLPQVRPMKERLHDPDLAGALWVLVDVPVEQYFGPAEKINITVPAMTLKRIDAYAAQRGESRSRFLVEAAEQVMRRVAG